MKKLILITLIFPLILMAQTPFILTGIKKVYPMVELNTKRLDPALKEVVMKKLLDTTKRLHIDTTGYSHRSLVVMINSSMVKDTLVFKILLIMGEEMKRLDDDEECFAFSYVASDSIEYDDFDEEIIESVEFLLEQFEEQYIEDNES